ncbi:MAG: FHA domain-containing protein [Anaerolineae bacterium]
MVTSSRLVQSQGPQPGQTFMLDQDELTLGREPHNKITISDPQVSRQHARIMRQGDLMVIEDAGSTNGTFVNGMRLTGPHALANGDVIGLGDAVTLTYYGPSPASTEPLAEQPTATMGQLSYEPPPPPAYTAPPPAYAAAPPPIAQAPVEKKKSKRGLWIGCGCLVLLAIGACVGVFVLDYLGMLPSIFYEPLRWLGLI